jgi:hypothetical protein
MPKDKHEKKSVLVRLKPELWVAIARMAEAELRSINAQIEYLLEQGVKKGKKTES